ncbi:MAG: DUF4388 domain-containing protein [Acidimicrobiia bacterium]|nr:DUF4388 domain-containing protein [Acidimicrobiia bacterium]MDH3463466.1 DUF4388 domain-containing protein [Acidimicrobiia bacterium]
MDNNMNLSGQLTDWTMQDLLQIMQVTKKTGSLDIVGEQKGRVHFMEGRVTGAELHSSRGVYAGTDRSVIADILFVLGSMDSGSFAVGKADGPDLEGWSVDEVAAGVEELVELEKEAKEAGLTGSGQIRIRSDLEEPVTFEPEDWKIITSLIQPFTFEGLEERLGRGAAVRMVHAFHRLEVAETKGDSDEAGSDSDADRDTESFNGTEADWLDRLADEVSTRDAGDPVTVEPGKAAVSDTLEEAGTKTEKAGARGVSADASTVLTGGVYDEIRRLRSKVGD